MEKVIVADFIKLDLIFNFDNSILDKLSKISSVIMTEEESEEYKKDIEKFSAEHNCSADAIRWYHVHKSDKVDLFYFLDNFPVGVNFTAIRDAVIIEKGEPALTCEHTIEYLLSVNAKVKQTAL